MSITEKNGKVNNYFCFFPKKKGNQMVSGSGSRISLPESPPLSPAESPPDSLLLLSGVAGAAVSAGVTSAGAVAAGVVAAVVSLVLFLL